MNLEAEVRGALLVFHSPCVRNFRGNIDRKRMKNKEILTVFVPADYLFNFNKLIYYILILIYLFSYHSGVFFCSV